MQGKALWQSWNPASVAFSNFSRSNLKDHLFKKIFPYNCIVLCHTLDHLSSHCKALLQKQGKCQLDFFCIFHCQCHNVRLSIFTMSKCHNVTIFTMSQYSQYLNVTLFTIYQCHKVKILHNVSMSQCHTIHNISMSQWAINSPGSPLCHDEASCWSDQSL